MKNLQYIIPPIISCAIFIVIAMLMATVPTLNFVVDQFFWAELIGSTIAMVLTYAVWIPTGEGIALKKRNIINNKKIYDARANYIVENQKFIELGDFTDYKNEKLKTEIIKDKLGTQVINYEVYELYIKRDKTNEELQTLGSWIAMLNEKQKALLIRLATKGVKFKKLTPKDITMGRASNNKIVNKNYEKIYRNSRIAMKSIWGIFTTCFTYFVVIVPNEEFGMAQAIMIIMWFFTFLTAIYSAIRTGYNSIAVYRNRYNLEQAELCAEFFAYAGIDVKDVDPKKEELVANEEN